MANTPLPKQLFAAVLLGALFVGVGVALSFISSDALAAEAKRLVSLCSKENNRPLCYDREIPKLMDDGYSMEEAFTVTRIVQDADPSYQYCHVLGHRLAEKETAKDPSKWIEVVHRAPQGLCSNGGIHGAFQERFRTESLPDAKIEELVPILGTVCTPTEQWQPTPLARASCIHALGHLSMYVTAADTKKSLGLCERVAHPDVEHDFRKLCYDGVFMQTFQPLEPEDFRLIEGKEVTRATRDHFCAPYRGDQRASCITESWPLYWEEIKTAKGTLMHCSVLAEPYRERCLRGIVYVETGQTHLREEVLIPYCSEFPGEFRDLCFANVASRLIETDWRNIDRSVLVCERAREFAAETGCFDELVIFATYNFPPASKESARLCNLLPEPWNGKCDTRRQEALASVYSTP